MCQLAFTFLEGDSTGYGRVLSPDEEAGVSKEGKETEKRAPKEDERAH